MKNLLTQNFHMIIENYPSHIPSSWESFNLFMDQRYAGDT